MHRVKFCLMAMLVISLIVFVFCSESDDNSEDNLPNSKNMKFIDVPGGTFMMGSEDGDDDERPVHAVTLDSFKISKYEVTADQYFEYLKASGKVNDPSPKDDEGNILTLDVVKLNKSVS